MDTRDAITRELLAGVTPAQLARKYPRKSVYRIYNELVQSGQLSGDEPSGIVSEVDPFKLAEPSTRTRLVTPTKQQVQATTPGAKTATGVSEIDKIRGVVGIYDQPKVLYMERPELLYIAMAMSLHYWGWSQMSTSDFIDTVLDDYIRASGKEYNVIVDTGRLGELVAFAKEQGFHFWDEKPIGEEVKVDTDGELPNNVKTLAVELEGRADVMEQEIDKVKEQEEAKAENEQATEEIEEGKDSEEVPETTEVNVEEPKKPTVGDLFARIHITNIQKEVKDGSPETT